MGAVTCTTSLLRAREATDSSRMHDLHGRLVLLRGTRFCRNYRNERNQNQDEPLADYGLAISSAIALLGSGSDGEDVRLFPPDASSTCIVRAWSLSASLCNLLVLLFFLEYSFHGFRNERLNRHVMRCCPEFGISRFRY